MKIIIPFIFLLIAFIGSCILYLHQRRLNFHQKTYKHINTIVGYFKLLTPSPTTILFVNDNYYLIDSYYSTKFESYCCLSTSLSFLNKKNKAKNFFKPLLDSYIKFFKHELNNENLIVTVNRHDKFPDLSTTESRRDALLNYYDVMKKEYIMDENRLKRFPRYMKERILSNIQPFATNIVQIFDAIQDNNFVYSYPKITDRKILRKAKRYRFFQTSRLIILYHIIGFFLTAALLIIRLKI